MSWDVGELRALAADLGEASASAQLKATQVVQKSAFDVQRLAAERAPVRTGFLASSIGVDFDSGDGLTATIGPAASYGIFVEAGTSRMRPQPYLGPAFDAVVPGFTAAMEQLGGGIL